MDSYTTSNITLIPQQRVIHQASMYQSRYNDYRQYIIRHHNVITTRLFIISCSNIMLTIITTALYAGSVYHESQKKCAVTVYRLPIRLPAKSALTWPVV